MNKKLDNILIYFESFEEERKVLLENTIREIGSVAYMELEDKTGLSVEDLLISIIHADSSFEFYEYEQEYYPLLAKFLEKNDYMIK